MVWTPSGSILLTSDWQYTEPITSGSFFRLKHIEAPNGGLFVIAQAEVDGEGKLSLIDSQVMAVEKPISDVLKLPKPGCFAERRIAIKKLPKQPTLEQEIKRLFLPGYLQPSDESIRTVARSNWAVDVEVSDFVEPTTSSGTGTGTTTPPPTSSTKTLTYASDGDTNGVCYWIGTNYGVESWSNPHTAGQVICSKSSESNPDLNNVASLVDRVANSTGTDDLPNSWMQIDLGITNKLIVSYYSLRGRTDVYNDNHLRNWKLQGSNDTTTWVDINTQIDNTIINGGNWVSIPTANETVGYRYLRILQTGLSSSNANYLSLGEFEFYGTLTKG